MITRIFTFVIVFLLIAFQSESQVNTQKKWHVTPTGRMYVNKELPVYLWISNTPNPSSFNEIYKLQSQSSKAFTNPFYFDNEGLNTLRTSYQVDTTTKKQARPLTEIKFEVFADGIPPITICKEKFGKKYTHNEQIFISGDLTLEFQAADETSGTENIFYSINNSIFSIYTNPLTLNQQKEYNITYFSIDLVGNVEEKHEKTYVIDTTPPLSSIKYETILSDNTIKKSALVSLSAHDSLSGVKRIEYFLDNNTPQIYKGPFSVGQFQSGDHTLTYYAIDNVGNTETPKVSKGSISAQYQSFIKLNRNTPIAYSEIVGPKYISNGMTYVSPQTKIKLYANDSAVNIKKITYGINQSGKNKTYAAPFALPDETGMQRINYYALDDVMNFSNPAGIDIYMDNVQPRSNVVVGIPQYADRDSLYISKNTPITFFGNDGESGINHVEIKHENDSFQIFKKEIYLTIEGNHQITHRSIDNVGNVSYEKTLNCVVDTTPPDIFVIFSVQPKRTEVHEGTNYPVYPLNTRLFIAATDKLSGTEDILYSANGSKWMDFYVKSKANQDASLLSEEKFYSIEIKTKDKVNNETYKKIEFFVSNK